MPSVRMCVCVYVCSFVDPWTNTIVVAHLLFFPIHFDSAESINKSDYGTKTVWCNLNTNSLVFIRLRANKWNFISFQANATGLVFCNMEWAIITRRFSFGANDDNRVVTILIFRSPYYVLFLLLLIKIRWNCTHE